MYPPCLSAAISACGQDSDFSLGSIGFGLDWTAYFGRGFIQFTALAFLVIL